MNRSYTPTAISSLKRSLAYRQTLIGEHFIEKDQSVVVSQYSNKKDTLQAAKCGLIDLSVLARTGLRGLPAQSIIKQQFSDLANTALEQVNFANISCNGELILRLGKTEYWILSSLTQPSESILSIEQTVNQTANAYSIYCQSSHCWFALTGQHISDIMAKLCGVDLNQSAFAVGQIAQTSVARVNAIVVRHSINDIPVFFILSDSASAEYLWLAIMDAMQEFNGQAIGLNVFL